VFASPDWSTKVDFAARLAATPEHAQVRGMFFQYMLDGLGPELAHKHGTRRYVSFKSYPMRDYLTLMAAGTRDAFPRLPSSEAARRLGRRLYPKYATTISGTAIFAAAGHSFKRVVELAPVAYRVALSPGTITVRELSDRHARVELREIWNVPDFHQVGIWEGAMEVCGAKGRIDVEVHGFDSVDFDIVWEQ
jgi:uncharacterized protein (TIGR02265 family)